jgi:hypothetical protein
MQFQYQSFQPKRLPAHQSPGAAAAAASNRSRIWSRFWVRFMPGWIEGVMIGLAALAVLGLLVLRVPGDCRSPRIAFKAGAVQDATMTVPRGRSCALAVKISSAQIVALSIETPPRFGALQRRGLTGATYRSDAAYRGEDSFAIALEGPGSLGAAAMLVRVKVVVK